MERKSRMSYNLSLPIFSFQNSAPLGSIVVVDVQGVCEGKYELAVVLSKLLVPTPPYHIVEANFVIPTESQASKAKMKETGVFFHTRAKLVGTG